MKRPRLLKYGGTCTGCSLLLPEKTRGYWEKDRGVRCVECGPHPFVEVKITVLRQTHWRSSTNAIMSRATSRSIGIAKQQGASGMTVEPSRKRHRKRRGATS